MVAATGIEAEKAIAQARRAELLNELSQSGLIKDISFLRKISSTSIANAVGDLFSDVDKGTKEALIRSAAAVAEARGEDSGLSFAGKGRDSILYGSIVKLGGISNNDVEHAEDYLRKVLDDRKAQSNEKSSSHFRELVTKTRGSEIKK